MRPGSIAAQDPYATTMFLIVGLPGAGKTTRAKELAAANRALRLTPDQRKQFQVPDAAELDGGEIPGPPAGWPGWAEWAVDHWPSYAPTANLTVWKLARV
jgi:AAA domain